MSLRVDPEAPMIAATSVSSEVQTPRTDTNIDAARADRMRGQPTRALDALAGAGAETQAVLRELGLSGFEAGEDSAAARHLRMAIQLDPKDAEALIALGRLQLRRKNILGAALNFRRAVKVADDPVLAAEARSRLNFPRRAAAEARRMYQRLRVGRDVRIDPGKWADDEGER